jgi:hypothetical protein
MAQQSKWRELHQAAMLELNREELLNSIVAARSAMNDRIQELRATGGEGGHSAELRAIADALHSLQSLERVECQASSAEPLNFVASEPGIANPGKAS